MRMKSHGIPGTYVLTLAGAIVAGLAEAQDVTFDALLNEMTSRRALATFPEPAFTVGQFSSYDRRSKTPDDPSDEGWFANADAGNYLRFEEYQGQRVGVMMDAAGPGAIVRIWSANPKGTLRIFLDHEDDPTLEVAMEALLTGSGPVTGPLAATRARGANLYLPIPYNEHCKITCDDPDDMYYLINYRTYEPGTRVQTFERSMLKSSVRAIRKASLALEAPVAVDPDARMHHSAAQRVLPGRTVDIFRDESGGAISLMMLRLKADDPRSALRSTILHLAFDGRNTVTCPLGDFFASGPGIVPYETWPFVVQRDGTMIARWFMPYESSFRMSVENLGEAPVELMASLAHEPYEWTDRSMHFHAGWRIESGIPTRPRRDFNLIALRGAGMYVGDALFVTNPVEAWWGEGDEKIYVDDEPFPSHFGTGTEDYYGFAWASSETFNAPFHNQPHVDGPGNYGHTAVNRFRSLDAIPFDTSLRVDMGVWHWRDVEIDYAVTTYWYALPDTIDNLPPITPDLVRVVPEPPPLPPQFTIEGVIEGESLTVTAKRRDFPVGPQELWKEQTYSNDQHLWVQAQQVGDWIELRVPSDVPAGTSQRTIAVYLTKSWDYGVVQFSVNGERAGEPIDTFNTDGRELGATGPIVLGRFEVGPTFTLRVEVVGTHARSSPPHYFFGLDAVKVAE